MSNTFCNFFQSTASRTSMPRTAERGSAPYLHPPALALIFVLATRETLLGTTTVKRVLPVLRPVFFRSFSLRFDGFKTGPQRPVGRSRQGSVRLARAPFKPSKIRRNLTQPSGQQPLRTFPRERTPFLGFPNFKSTCPNFPNLIGFPKTLVGKNFKPGIDHLLRHVLTETSSLLPLGSGRSRHQLLKLAFRTILFRSRGPENLRMSKSPSKPRPAKTHASTVSPWAEGGQPCLRRAREQWWNPCRNQRHGACRSARGTFSSRRSVRLS